METVRVSLYTSANNSGKEMKTFAIGDIHGGYKALIQCLARSGFRFEEDKLIVLGDVCDGWPDTRQCIDLLLQIKNLVFIMGNHDFWVLEWALYGDEPAMWVTQGGDSTMLSYGNLPPPEEHIEFLKSGIPLYIDDKNRAFVHGGFDRTKDPRKQSQQVLMWDRELIYTACEMSKMKGDKPKKLTEFEEVFLGHTPVSSLLLPMALDTPVHLFEIWDLDTGGGWEGKLTIMDVDSHEYWQSAVVHELYPGEHGRQGQQMRQRIKGYLG